MLNEQGDNIIFFYEEYKRMKSRIELLEILAEAENDVNNKRTTSIAETFDDLRQMLQKSKSI
ncbi:toxin-antitoxin system antitoxin component PHD family [Eubacterium sp. CAG:192]|nr:toxin-antitoxin system antitoxin component PHD family [Eubacterium sp. CAG:192]